jgi:AAA domain
MPQQDSERKRKRVIIGADQRLNEKRGVKALIVGPPGVGKTSLLRTLNPVRTLFVDIEAGDLSVQDVPVDTARIDDWPSARDLACRISGPNPSFPETACYSPAHYEAIGGALESLDKYDTIFVDSITAISRLSFRWSEQQPEAFAERSGKKDIRSAYGLHGREMIAWLNQLQHARGKNVVFVAVLEKIIDEFNKAEWQLQLEGAKTGREFARHRRPDHHNAMARLWRRRPVTRIRVHEPKQVGLACEGSQWPARTDRRAQSRKTHR